MDVLRPGSGISPEEWEICSNPEYGDRPMDRQAARFVSGCTVRSSMISAGCIIEGTVTNSVLSPGVWVRKGAVVNNAVIFHDSVIEENAKVDLAICDKRVYVREGAIVGYGDQLHVANKLFPKHLYTGITLVGKEARIPAQSRIGRNCRVNYGFNEDDSQSALELADGESV